jgi:hypothetical protein
VSRGTSDVQIGDVPETEQPEAAPAEPEPSGSPGPDTAGQDSEQAPTRASAADNGGGPAGAGSVANLQPLPFGSDDDASDFDGVATSLVDGLATGLGSLRGLVVGARSTAVHDREQIARLEQETGKLQREIAQLNQEIARLGDELAQRNTTIGEMKQALRTLADHLD